VTGVEEKYTKQHSTPKIQIYMKDQKYKNTEKS